ncbi:MAG: oligosaccharide flippase family protein [Flavobacteriaceae bacterium]|nr:oligosaccharide flippase family protein [Flavobacteriaceae bacterium]
MKDQNTYRQILKATSLFSGVQLLNILFSIIKSKFAAVLIGPSGMGILGLFNSTLNLASVISKLGLDLSSVKEIAYAKQNLSTERVDSIIYVLKKLVWVSGLIGALSIIIFSKYLSVLVFDSKDYAFSFVWIAIALFFRQITLSNLAILQGQRRLVNLAKANVYASGFSLVISIALFYYFGVDGIVPFILLSAIFGYYISHYFNNYKVSTQKKLTLKETIFEGKGMIKLGLTLSVTSLFSILTVYMLQIYVKNVGGISEVGFYNVGFLIINTYVGMVFNAMGKDYFPRLSAVSDNFEKASDIIIKQALIGVLLVTPIIIIFLSFAPTLIRLFFSAEFLVVVSLVSFGLIGIVFKAASWSMGYYFIAKGDSKVYIKTAIGFNALLLLMSIIGYDYDGLRGLGISFLAYYIIHFSVIYLIMKFRYLFSLNKEFIYVFLACICFCLISLVLTFIGNAEIKYILLTVMIILSSWFTLYFINKKVDLRSVINSFIGKKND